MLQCVKRQSFVFRPFPKFPLALGGRMWHTVFVLPVKGLDMQISRAPQFFAAAAAEDGRPPEWIAWQNLWKTEPWKTDAKTYAKAPKLTVGEIELKFGASGAVTAKCSKGSCATVLIPMEDGTFYVFCYFAPKGEEAYAAEISLVWDGDGKKFSVVEQ